MKFGKKIIAEYSTYIDQEEVTIIVLDGKDCYDVHRITERFANDRLNSLYLQEPKESIECPEEYFGKAYLIGQVVEYIAWSRFSGVGSASVQIELEDYHE